MNKKKILSVILSTVMMTTSMFSIAACSKTLSGKKATKNAVVKVEENSEWYDSQRMSIDTDYEKEYDLEWASVNGDPCVTEDGVIIFAEGSRKSDLTEDEIYELSDEEYTEYYRANRFNQLEYYDFDGNRIWSLDVNKCIDFDSDDLSLWISGAVSDGDKCYLRGYLSGEVDGEWVDTQVKYEVDVTNATVNPNPIMLTATEVPQSYGDASLEKTVEIPGYVFNLYYSWGEDQTYYIISVIDESGKETTIDTREALPGINVYDIADVSKIDDNSAFIFLSTDSTSELYTIDLTSMKISEYEKPETLDDVYFYDIIQLDNKFYSRDSEGIYEVDFVEGTKTQIFTFANCNIDLFEATSLSLGRVSEDEILLYGNIWHEIGSEVVVYKITKADKNPNAGKIILTASNLDGYMTESLGLAIYNFNNENEKYFISYNEDYAMDYSDIDFSASSEDYNTQILKKQTDLSKQLSIDLMNGEGPDILINAYAMQQINTSEYLVDLSSYMKDVNDADYFVNIIDAAKTDDKLYQLPLTFSIYSLSGPKGLSENGIGFTFDEYLDVVDDECNGTDPLTVSYGRLELFSTLLSQMSSSLIDSKGNVKIDTDEFRALCEYCKDMPEQNYYESNPDVYGGSMYYYEEMDTGSLSVAYLGSAWEMIDNCIRNSEGQGIAFYGFPSYDGHGPVAQIYDSVAISASCANCDGAWEFISEFMSEEVLEKYYSFSISRNVFDAKLSEQIERYNKEVEDFQKWYSEAEAMMYGLPYKKVNEDDVKPALDVIEAITSIDSIDIQMLQIITEEIQPFFADQKSLEDVLMIMEDKCQTVIDERD